MNVLYLSYWNFGDPLTSATVFPALDALLSTNSIDEVVFVNVERGSSGRSDTLREHPRLTHIQLHARHTELGLMDRFVDFARIPLQLLRIVRERRVDAVLARGASAGSLAYLLSTVARIPFYVESFEPHASYMLESGVWTRSNPRYVAQTALESAQRRFAAGLMPVSNGYARLLQDTGVPPTRIRVVPCGVDASRFSFSRSERSTIREQLGVSSSCTVGIYCGKFGGLYLEERAFELYASAFEELSDFFLILLSPEAHHSWIESQLRRHAIPRHRVLLRHVAHSEVASYLSASDIAFATYKPGPSRAFLSPVKVGEYWANGLPVLLTQGVGDEAEIIAKGFGGELFDPQSSDVQAFLGPLKRSASLARAPEMRASIASRGSSLRSFAAIRDAYDHFFPHP